MTVSSLRLQGTRSTTSRRTARTSPLLPPVTTAHLEMQASPTPGRRSAVGGAATTLDQEMVLEGEPRRSSSTAATRPSRPAARPRHYNYKEVFEKLPVNRDIRDAVLLTAGVSSTGRAPAPRATAASRSRAPSRTRTCSWSTAWSSPRTWRPALRPLHRGLDRGDHHFDRVVSAEYGRFAGGVINTITKSVGHELHGSFRTNLTNDDWVSSSNPSHPERTDELTRPTDGHARRLLWRDKAWYFLAGRDLERGADPDHRPGQRCQPDHALVTTPGIPSLKEGPGRYEGSSLSLPLPGHRLTASYLEIEDTEAGNRFITNVLDLRS